MDLNEILSETGDFGKYQQLMLWFVFLPAQLPYGCHAYSQIFMSLNPDHWCRVSVLDHLSANISEERLRELSVPYGGQDTGRSGYSQCTAYKVNTTVFYNHLANTQSWIGNSSWPVEGCSTGWHYNRTKLGEDQSVVTAWDLVCDRAWIPTLALSLFGLGGFLGQCFYLLLVYKFGRRPVFFLYLGVQCILGVATAFAPDITIFILIRVMLGFTVPGVIATPAALAIDVIPASMRSGVIFLNYVARSSGVILLSIVSYLIRDWSHLAVATTLPFYAFFLYWWVLPESPRWLITRGRYEETGKLLRVMAQTNGKCLSPDFVVNLKRRFRIESALQNEKKLNDLSDYGLESLFRTPNMCKKTVVITFLWFTNTTVCVGLTYYSVEFSEDIYKVFFLVALAEPLALMVPRFTLRRCGRRCTVCLSSTIGGILCLCTAVMQKDTFMSLVFYLLCKLSISSSCAVLPVWASELFPAVVRETGLNFSDTLGLLGSAIIPPVLHQGRRLRYIPLVFMGALPLLSGLAGLLLPETLWQRPLQTLEDGEELGKRWTWKDCLRCTPPKIEPKNGILKNRGPQPQSPILSLLRRQESLRQNSEIELDTESPSAHGISILEPIKVTVL